MNDIIEAYQPSSQEIIDAYAADNRLLRDEILALRKRIAELHHEIGASREEIEKLRGVPQEQLACDCGAPTEGEWADKHTAGCALRAEIDRLRNFSDKAMKEWQHALCREGKMIGRITSPISQSDSDS